MEKNGGTKKREVGKREIKYLHRKIARETPEEKGKGEKKKITKA